MIKAARLEIGNHTLENCSVLSSEELMAATKSNLLDWDMLQNYARSPNQPVSSYSEHKNVIKHAKQAIDEYYTLSISYTKCVGIRGFPGSGKT